MNALIAAFSSGVTHNIQRRIRLPLPYSSLPHPRSDPLETELRCKQAPNFPAGIGAVLEHFWRGPYNGSKNTRNFNRIVSACRRSMIGSFGSAIREGRADETDQQELRWHLLS